VNDRCQKPFQFSMRWLLGLFVVIALLLTVGLFTKGVMQIPVDAYKQWAAGDLVVAYMEANSGAWPQSWDDLRATCASLGGRLPGGQTIESLEEDVNIDFRFDPTLASAAITEGASKPSFRVIWLKNGSDAHYAGQEPNQRVFDFLKSRKFEGR
jgi:hypothetical protein